MSRRWNGIIFCFFLSFKIHMFCRCVRREKMHKMQVNYPFFKLFFHLILFRFPLPPSYHWHWCYLMCLHLSKVKMQGKNYFRGVRIFWTAVYCIWDDSTLQYNKVVQCQIIYIWLGLIIYMCNKQNVTNNKFNNTGCPINYGN